jgi:hypothetical protein
MNFGREEHNLEFTISLLCFEVALRRR